jgi:hypothetical protein
LVDLPLYAGKSDQTRRSRRLPTQPQFAGGANTQQKRSPPDKGADLEALSIPALERREGGRLRRGNRLRYDEQLAIGIQLT